MPAAIRTIERSTGGEMRNVKSPRITPLARLALSEDLRSLVEEQTRKLQASPSGCDDEWHTAPSKAKRKKRYSDTGTPYYAWLGTMRCPKCKESSNSSQSPYSARLAGKLFPSVCVLPRERIKAELASVTLSQHDLVPQFSDGYRPPKARWFLGCAVSLPPIDSLQETLIWAERRRSYAHGIAVSGVPVQRFIAEETKQGVTNETQVKAASTS
jgi:hypothetical protein